MIPEKTNFFQRFYIYIHNLHTWYSINKRAVKTFLYIYTKYQMKKVLYIYRTCTWMLMEDKYICAVQCTYTFTFKVHSKYKAQNFSYFGCSLRSHAFIKLDVPRRLPYSKRHFKSVFLTKFPCLFYINSFRCHKAEWTFKINKAKIYMYIGNMDFFYFYFTVSLVCLLLI
jgi:hypothetical protein